MWKKVITTVGLTVAVMAASAQIGYKGQLTLGATGGVNQTGGLALAAHVGGYLSPHSILGVGVLYDKTSYIGGEDDAFHVAQWLGNIHYQYSLPIGRFILLPTGGVLLGVEKSDPTTKQGNLIMNGSKFVYGLNIEFGIEYVLGRHWALALEPRLAYLINANFDNVKVSIGAGVKYYF